MSTLSRRRFLKLSAVTALGAAVAACSQPTPTPAPTKPAAAPTAVPPTAVPATAVPATKPPEPTKPAAVAPTNTAVPPTAVPPTAVPKPAYKEAPMLADLVKAGKLPAVDLRLPTSPCVCPVMTATGKFGGTMRRGFTGVSDVNGPSKLQEAGLMWFNADLTLRPDIAETMEMSADAKEWTFRIRKGIKWSDGTPLDTTQFKWWYDNVLMNKTLTPAVSSNWGTGSPLVPMTQETPDAYTIKYKFTHPNPLFAYRVTRSQTFIPVHYMKQYHNDTAADKAALEKEFKDAKFAAWDVYFTNKNTWALNPDRPNIGPWIAKNKLSEEQFLMERNPYFWQVDKDGNQLPYLDKVIHRLYSTPDVFSLWIVNGEIDFQNRGLQLGNYTLYKNNEKKGDYTLKISKSVDCLVFVPNHTTKNKRLREFNQNPDVRKALSYAINREEIHDLIYNGLGVVRQYSPLTVSPEYYPKLSNNCIEYDVKKANSMLDAAGYKDKDAQGFRKWKDGSGETISFIIESTSAAGTSDADEIEMVCKYFGAVGVKATHKPVERALYTQHYNANEIEWASWTAGRTAFPILVPATFLGTMFDIPWALAWGFWVNDPKNQNAEEPPQGHWFRKMWDIWNQIAVEPDAKKRTAMFLTILDIWVEQLPILGNVGENPALQIVKNTMINFKEGLINDDTTRHESLIPTQTMFWEDPSKHV